MDDFERCGRTKRDGSGEPCRNPAGKETDHLGEGACKFHGGNAGAPEGNTNARKHALTADPFDYYESLPQEEQAFIQGVIATIEDRIRANTGEVDTTDRQLAKRIAIELHIVSKASDYVENESGLVEPVAGGQDREKAASLLGDIRKRDNAIFELCKTVGILNDPESQTAEALAEWEASIDGNRD